MSDNNEAAPKKQHCKWFNRIWACVSGIVIGIAAMFGIDKAKVEDTVKATGETLEAAAETIEAAKDKDWEAVKENAAATVEAGKAAAEKGKEVYEIGKNTFDYYQAQVDEIQKLCDAGDWKAAHDKAVYLADLLVKAFPEEVLNPGPAKAAYGLLKDFITDLDAGKYDQAVLFAKKVKDTFKKAN